MSSSRGRVRKVVLAGELSVSEFEKGRWWRRSVDRASGGSERSAAPLCVQLEGKLKILHFALH